MPCVGRAAVAHESAQQERLRRMEAAVREILRGLGEDVQREGLRDTPKRVAKALIDVTAGYALDPVSAIGSALFHEPIVAESGSGIVLVRDIDFASTSEHTLQPFHGRCHIAYLPADGVVLGLSKLARVTKLFAKRLQSQARLGTDIAAALCKTLGCNDVAVVVQARSLSSPPGPDLPQEVISAALHGCFASSGSTHLLELQELLGVSISGLAGSRPHLPSSSSVLSIGLSCDSESFSVAAPQTPDASEKDTDGESDDAGMAAEGDTLESMEAAAQQLVAEISGDPDRPELQGTARRYIMSLLASTSGYHQKLPGSCQQQQDQGACRQEISADNAMDGVEAEHDARSCCSTSSTVRASTTACEHAGVPLCVQHATMQFRSLCEHHMLPFYGKVHVAYLQPGSGNDSSGTAEPAAAVGSQGVGCSPLGSDPAPAPLLQLGELEQVVGVYTQRLQVQERITHQVADAVAQLLQQRAGASGLGVVVLVDAAHMCMVARGIESHSGSTTSLAVRGEVLQASPELRCTMLREARRAAMRQ